METARRGGFRITFVSMAESHFFASGAEEESSASVSPGGAATSVPAASGIPDY